MEGVDMLESLGKARHYLFEAMLATHEEDLRKKLNDEWLNIAVLMQKLGRKEIEEDERRLSA
jgi:hypothetical protein